jgi:hypothetical protein
MSTSLHARFVFFVGLLGLSALLGACGSSGSSGSGSSDKRPEKTGQPMRVLFVQYTPSQKFELVNDSHSNRVEMYSSAKKVEEAYAKVTTDEVLREVIAMLDDNGFAKRAVPGSAPPTSDGSTSRVFEIERDGKTSFWAVGRGANADEVKRFNDSMSGFLAIYTNTYGLQAVEGTPTWDATSKKKKVQ